MLLNEKPPWSSLSPSFLPQQLLLKNSPRGASASRPCPFRKVSFFFLFFLNGGKSSGWWLISYVADSANVLNYVLRGRLFFFVFFVAGLQMQFDHTLDLTFSCHEWRKKRVARNLCPLHLCLHRQTCGGVGACLAG